MRTCRADLRRVAKFALHQRQPVRQLFRGARQQEICAGDRRFKGAVEPAGEKIAVEQVGRALTSPF